MREAKEKRDKKIGRSRKCNKRKKVKEGSKEGKFMKGNQMGTVEDRKGN